MGLKKKRQCFYILDIVVYCLKRLDGKIDNLAMGLASVETLTL